MNLLDEPKVQEIITAVCENFQVSLETLQTSTRYHNHVMARAFVYKLIRDHYQNNVSLKDIGAIFNRDHATVMNGLEKCADLCDTNRLYSDKMDCIIQTINGNIFEPKKALNEALEIESIEELKNQIKLIIEKI